MSTKKIVENALGNDIVGCQQGSELGLLAPFAPMLNCVAVSLVLTGNDTVVEGGTYTLNIAASGDDLGGVTGYTINWGDGSDVEAVSLGDNTHTFSTPSTTPTIVVTAIHPTRNIGATKTIAVIPLLEISTTTAPSATLGVGYSKTIEFAGGIAPYTWSVSAGSLPDGLSLLDNRILGFPYTAESETFTVMVQSNDGQSDTVELTITASGTLTAIETRKAQVAAHAAAEAVPTFTGSGKYVHGNVEARLKCDITDQEALDALEATATIAAYQKNQFGAMSTARLFVQFKSSLPTSLKIQLLAIARENVKHQYAIGTENINLMRKCAGILYGESEPAESFAWDNGTDSGSVTGAEMAATLKSEFLAWVQRMWSFNEWEFNSPVYISVSQVALLTLIEYSTDDEVVAAARLLFDHLAHNVHVHAIDNVIFPSKRNRQRIEGTPQGSTPELGTQWTDWIYFGSDISFTPAPEHPHQRSAYFAALSSVQPSDWVLNYTATTPYEAKFRAASFSYTHPSYVNDIAVFSNTLTNFQKKFPARESQHFTKAYIHDYYLLADGKYYDALSLEGYDDFFGCVWKSGDTTARLLVCHPYTNWNRPLNETVPYEDDEPGLPAPGDPLEDEDLNMESPFKSSGQRENVQAIIFDIPGSDPYAADITLAPYVSATLHEAFYVYVPDELTYVETVSGIRFYADGDIYVGIKCTAAPTVEATVWPGYSRLKVAGTLEGLWLAIGHADEYTNYAGFKTWFSGATFTDNLASTGALSYSNNGGAETLDVTKHDGSYPLLPTVSIDSVAEDPTAWLRREWPGIKANNGFQLFCDGSDQVEVFNWSQSERADFSLWETNITVTAESSDTLVGSVDADNEARLYASATEFWDIDDFDLTIDSSVVPVGKTITEVRVYATGDRPTEFITGDDRYFDASIGNWVAVGTNTLNHDAANGWAHIALDGNNYLGCYVVVSNLIPGADYVFGVDIKDNNKEGTANEGEWYLWEREHPDVDGKGAYTEWAIAPEDGVTLEFTASQTTHRLGVALTSNPGVEIKFDNCWCREKTLQHPGC